MESVLFKNDLFEIGQFVIRPSDSDFDKKGFIDSPLIVFPNNSIWIQHQGKDYFVADSSVINLYNRNQVYSRAAIDSNGDNCIWIKPSDEFVEQMSAHDGSHIFAAESQSCAAKTYLRYLQLMNRLSEASELEIEEQVLSIFDDITMIHEKRQNDAPHSAAHIRLVNRIKSSIHCNLSENQSLQDIAKEVFSSPFHISRVFKKVTGIGLNQFRNQIRLKKICTELGQSKADLATLALNYGYSSHSHLSHNFKRFFGFSPSSFN